MNRIVAVIIGVVGVGVSSAHAQLEPPEKRFAYYINVARERVAEAPAQFAQLEASYLYVGEFIKLDLAAIKPAYEKLATAWQVAGAAYLKGEQKEAERLWREAERAQRDAEIWRERLDCRAHQVSHVPNEWYYLNATRGAPAATLARLETAVAAKRAASEAWGELADATTPEADRDKLFARRERAIDLAKEAELAHWLWERAFHRDQVMHDKTVSSPEVQRLAAALAASDEAMAKSRRSQAAAERAMRAAERERAAMEKELERAFAAALKARDEAKQREKR